MMLLFEVDFYNIGLRQEDENTKIHYSREDDIFCK